MTPKEEKIILGYNTEIRREPPYTANILGENVYWPSEISFVLAIANRIHLDCGAHIRSSDGSVKYVIVCPEHVRSHFDRYTLETLETIAKLGTVASERKAKLAEADI